MIKLNIVFKYINIFAACSLLSACLGGTIAQQVARSIATSIADKSMARAMDVDEDQPYSNRKPNYGAQTTNNQINDNVPQNTILQPYKPASTANSQQSNKDEILRQSNLAKQSLQNYQPDPFKLAMANTAFNEIKPNNVNPTDAKPITEPLPQELAEIENSLEVIQSSQLVRVELFNLLIGDEKNAVYEQARLIGATGLPHKREWQNWRVATGAIDSKQSTNKKVITFLIPPEFGKLPAGSLTMVELASPGELNIARYKAQ